MQFNTLILQTIRLKSIHVCRISHPTTAITNTSSNIFPNLERFDTVFFAMKLISWTSQLTQGSLISQNTVSALLPEK